MKQPHLLLLALLSLSGCVVLDDPEWLDDDDTTVADDDDDDTPVPCTDPDDPENWITEPPEDWKVGASFVDPQGEPLLNLTVTLCASACFLEPTNCVGETYFRSPQDDIYVLEPLGVPDDDYARWSRSFDFVTYPGSGQIDLVDTPFVLPEVSEIEPVGSGAQERIFASGLEVRFDGDAVELPFGPKEATLGSVEIPPERYPVGGLMGWTPRRVFAMAVWELEIEEADGFQLVVPLDEALPEGEEVSFLVAHYDYSIISGTFELFPAELNAARTEIRTPAGQGLDRSTLWIAASRPPQPSPGR